MLTVDWTDDNGYVYSDLIVSRYMAPPYIVTLCVCVCVCVCRAAVCQFCLRHNSDVQRLVSSQCDVTATVDDLTVSGIKPSRAVCVVESTDRCMWDVQLRRVSWHFIRAQPSSETDRQISTSHTQYCTLRTTHVRRRLGCTICMLFSCVLITVLAAS